MVYSGNKLINANNATCVLLLIFFIAVATQGTHTKPIDTYIGIGFMPFIFLITINEAFYFEATDSELIVLNYVLPFIKTRYALSEITEIKIVGTNRRATAKAALKVVRDYKSSLAFRGGSLAVDDWKNLIDDLGNRQIEVSVSASGLIDGVNFD